MDLEQNALPLAEALNAQRINRLAHFDVPAHKGGRMNSELSGYFGKLCMELDVNSMKPLDNLGHPVSVIKDAQELAAAAFGAVKALGDFEVMIEPSEYRFKRPLKIDDTVVFGRLGCYSFAQQSWFNGIRHPDVVLYSAAEGERTVLSWDYAEYLREFWRES